MVRCCDSCDRESTASGIARHRKHCKEYSEFTAKRHTFGLRIAEAKLKYRRAKALRAQQLRQEPESVQSDDTVSISVI